MINNIKYFVVSDIHDQYDILINCLKSNSFEFNNPEHKLIICGDAFSKGPNPKELFIFLSKLYKDNRLIYIFGNHDLELLKQINNNHFNSYNRKCASLICNKFDLNDEELSKGCKKIGFTDFLTSSMAPFFEFDKYIFVHGFIPTKSHKYINGWRDLPRKAFESSTTSDGLKLSKYYGIYEPNKIIVFGHYTAGRCYLMDGATEIDWDNKKYKNICKVPIDGFKTYYSENFICLDSHIKQTKFLNCLALDNK